MAGSDYLRKWSARVTPDGRALALSLLAHACIVALLSALGPAAARPAPRIALNVVVAEAQVAAPALSGAVAEKSADEPAVADVADSAPAERATQGSRPELRASARRELRQGPAVASTAPVRADADYTPDTVPVIAPADVERMAALAQLQLEAAAEADLSGGSGPGSPGGGNAAEAAGAAADGSDAADAVAADATALLGEYTALIKRRIEDAKFYPPAAERRGQRGVVRVSFTVGADGGVSGIHVKDGSGYRTLDEAAAEAVRRAGRFPEIPPALERQSLSLSVALRYNLAEQE